MTPPRYTAEHPYGEPDYDAKKFSGGPVTLPPRYETLELVVPDPPRPMRDAPSGIIRFDVRPDRGRIVWIVLQTVAWFLIGVLIGYTLATPRSGPDRATSLASLGLSGAPQGAWDSSLARAAGRPRSETRFESVRGASLSGWATWYQVAPGNAAAGPALRAWLGSGWRGTAVKVCHGGCIWTVLTDFCQCGDRSGRRTLIDLARADFAVIAPVSSGVTTVTISRAGAIALPATDTLP